MEARSIIIGLCMIVIGVIFGRLSMAIQVAIMKPSTLLDSKEKIEISPGSEHDISFHCIADFSEKGFKRWRG